jgi:UDP-N-acetylmuramate dehydrogenase
MHPEFIESLADFNIKYNEPLAPYTTWNIGGPAEMLIVTNTADELVRVIKAAIKFDTPYTILGGGSNVLISDNGINGLVIINKSREIEIIDNNEENKELTIDEATAFNPWIQPRHGEEDDGFYTFKDLDYIETGERVKVKVASGVDLTWATAWTIKNGATGLQFFAGIPGTIGGALFNNIHGGTKHFSDYFYSARVLVDGEEKEYKFEDFNFGYDQSVLRDNKNIVVIEVVLNLFRGDTEKARFVANEWTKRKRRQPRRTAGCTFKNIPLEKQQQLGFPTPSVGYIVDKLFGWTGKTSGEAEISPSHANFIENKGKASSEDVKNLINQVKTKAKQDYDLDLETEINLLGF